MSPTRNHHALPPPHPAETTHDHHHHLVEEEETAHDLHDTEEWGSFKWPNSSLFSINRRFIFIVKEEIFE
jgi:hypothetical protein